MHVPQSVREKCVHVELVQRGGVLVGDWFVEGDVVEHVADLVERHGENSWAAHIVLGYFCVYFILGATLFSTFYPWT